MGSKFTVKISFILIAVTVLVSVAFGERSKLELKLVNVLFRHGDRAPDPSEVYPNDPHRNQSYYPMNRGGLTNSGKRRSYALGQVLKSMYGSFIGPIYEPWAIEARSSDYDRTKMSLQLVLSALYPPAPLQNWNNDLPWQPIPSIYRRLSEDILFEPELCPKYLAELERVRKSPEVLEELAEFSDMMASLETLTGSQFRTSWDMYNLYLILTAESAFGLELPAWSADIFPRGKLFNGTVLEYRVVSYNQKLKRLNGGMFVRKISEDLTAYRSGTLPAGRKIYLYSGHETNIAALLIALGVYDAYVPDYTSSIIIELWQQEEQYFVKVLHYLGIPPTTKVLTLPGCQELCPLDTFLELTKSVVPFDSDLICVKKSSQSTQSDPSTNSIPL